MVTARWLAVALLALLSAPTLAAAQDKVELVLDWQIQGRRRRSSRREPRARSPAGAWT